MDNKRTIILWHVIGALFATFAGSALHFVFEWAGRLKPVALIAAVNESTWEHLKIAFWPMLIFAVFEYFMYGKEKSNFLLAKAFSFYLVPIAIIGLFYGYTAIIPDNLFFDIGIFVIAIILGYYFSYKIMSIEKKILPEWIPLILILLIILAFSLFTYFPPKMFLFLDPVSGGFGI